MDEMIFMAWDRAAEFFIDYKLRHNTERCYLLVTNNDTVTELKREIILSIEKWSHINSFDEFEKTANTRFEKEVYIEEIDLSRPIYLWACCKGKDLHELKS